jgi:hypothetical protein
MCCRSVPNSQIQSHSAAQEREQLEMSYDESMSIWVGDLDGFVHIFDDDDYYKEESRLQELENDLDKLGEILLFSGKATSARSLNKKGISPQEWRWAVHEAENALHDYQDWSNLEPRIVKDLLNLGRRYAVARYAKWESITYYSALTATFPHGFRALLDQFLMTENAIGAVEQRPQIQSSVQIANAATDLAAYHRTAIVRSAMHKSAIDAYGLTGHLHFDKDRMKNMLSLTRLHYCVRETRVQSLSELNNLDLLYEDARIAAQRSGLSAPSGEAKQIKNWELRHLHPLIYLYPFSIRHALLRAKKHLDPSSEHSSRTTAVNELALARCGIMLMRTNAKANAESS